MRKLLDKHTERWISVVSGCGTIVVRVVCLYTLHNVIGAH